MGSHPRQKNRAKGAIQIKGIYKITNRINGKSYVGQSFDIEQRVREHYSRYDKPSSNQYDSLLYRAMRKHGAENFVHKVLIQNRDFTRDRLNELEIYFIEREGSFGDGYNMNMGGNHTSGTKKLDSRKAKEIKELITETEKSLTQISELTQVSVPLVSMINQGRVWRHVGDFSYPLREGNSHSRQGGKNNNAKISDKDAIRMREQFVSHTLDEVFESNKHLLSYSSVKKVVYGVSFKNLPIYKKRQKKWFLDGTCIDYPRLEE